MKFVGGDIGDLAPGERNRSVGREVLPSALQDEQKLVAVGVTMVLVKAAPAQTCWRRAGRTPPDGVLSCTPEYAEADEAGVLVQRCVALQIGKADFANLRPTRTTDFALINS